MSEPKSKSKSHIRKHLPKRKEPKRFVIWQQLLEGKSPKELIQQGFSKATVYRAGWMINRLKERIKTDEFARNFIRQFLDIIDDAEITRRLAKMRSRVGK